MAKTNLDDCIWLGPLSQESLPSIVPPQWSWNNKLKTERKNYKHEHSLVSADYILITSCYYSWYADQCGILMADCYSTLTTATRYGRIMTNAVIRSSFSSKLLVTLLLDAYGNWSKSGEEHALSVKKVERRMIVKSLQNWQKLKTNQQNKTWIESRKEPDLNTKKSYFFLQVK